jgi:hypothetical protein
MMAKFFLGLIAYLHLTAAADVWPHPHHQVLLISRVLHLHKESESP